MPLCTGCISSMVLWQLGIASSTNIAAICAQPSSPDLTTSNTRHRLTNRRRAYPQFQRHRRQFQKTSSNREPHRPSEDASLRHLTLKPFYDASIFQNPLDDSAPSNGSFLSFKGGSSSDSESSAKIESLILYDLAPIHSENANNDLLSAELHLCKLLSWGELFEPDGILLQFTSIEPYWDMDWTEHTVNWDTAPDPIGGGGTFKNSYHDRYCRWDVYDMFALVEYSMHSPDSSLSVRIGSSYENVGMYASKEYRGGVFAPKLDVYFINKESKDGASSLSDDSLISSPDVKDRGSGDGALSLSDDNLVSSSSVTSEGSEDGASSSVTSEGSEDGALSLSNDNMISSPSVNSEGIDDIKKSAALRTVIYGCSYQGTRIEEYSKSVNYKEGMTISFNNTIYECRPFPFSAWCTIFQPGSKSLPWNEAWSEVAECEPFVYSAIIENGCDIPPFLLNDYYKAFDRVRLDDAVYECKPDPRSSWCSMLSYEPGMGANWKMAWTKLDMMVGPCDEDITPSDEPMGTPVVYPFSSNQAFHPHDRVYQEGIVYECKPDPLGSWCSVIGYEPGSGPYWKMAWKKIDGAGTGEDNAISDNVVATPAFSLNEGAISRCAPVYDEVYTYSLHDVVSSENYNYLCVAPVWCNVPFYAPYQGNIYKFAAWEPSDEPCVGEPSTTKSNDQTS